MKKIVIQNLGHTYEGASATLKGLDVEIVEGERVAFVGPSGCGKTTFLRILAGLLGFGQGTITCDGKKLNSLAPLGDLSLVFQDANLLPWRVVKDNIALPLELRKDQIVDRELEDMMARVGLSGCGHLYPDSLSGGMRMRVSLARAFITHPKTLLLDEPFGALDELTREKMGEELLRLWRKERPTTILITHDISEAIYLCDRVVVMAREARPLQGEFQVQVGDDRSLAWRESLGFLELKRKISACLRKGEA